ncbi:hypothetical protein [Streptomyces fradiae]
MPHGDAMEIAVIVGEGVILVCIVIGTTIGLVTLARPRAATR